MKMASENGVPNQSDDDGGTPPTKNGDSSSTGTSIDRTPSSSSATKQVGGAKTIDHIPPTDNHHHQEPKKLSNGFPENSTASKTTAESTNLVAGSSDDEKLPTMTHTPPDQLLDSKNQLSGSHSQLVPTISTSTESSEQSVVTNSELSVEGGEGSRNKGAVEQPGSVEPSMATEPEDRVIANSPDGRFLKYDIVIGRGSFKTVYKGLDTETGVAVAWCELQENRYNKAEQARFKEEVAILKTLQHPNILKLYDSWEVTSPRGGGMVSVDKKDRKLHVLVLVTELMTSGTLKGYMRRLKAIKPKVIRSWGRQILRGLHFLHTRSQPIIHRDLKCDNIFINGTTGLVKIGDLGLATLKRSDVKTVIGTPEFMAPEMYDEHYDESVDVYAFGMCLLEMSSGEYPYMECSNPAQIYKKVTQGIMPNALDKVRDPVLRDIINKCITLDKENRYSVKHLLDHEFFAENVKFEIVEADENEGGGGSSEDPILTMRMELPTKELTAPKTNKGQESIEFVYDLHKDDPAEVVNEMVKSGVLRNEDQKSAVRSLREYLDTIKQKRVPKDSALATAASGEVAMREKEPSSRTSLTPVPVTGPSMAPGLSTISEASLGGDEELQAPPKLQRLVSEENQSASSVVSTSSAAATASSAAAEMGGDVGGAEEGGVVTTKGQDVVGGALPNGSAGVPSTPHSAAATVSHIEPSNLVITKRSDTAPSSTPVHQPLNRAPSDPVSSGAQNTLGATSQSNIHATPDQHQSAILSEDERKLTVRTNSNESEKSVGQSQTSVSSPDEKQSVGAEGLQQVQKEATMPPSNSLSVQTASSRSLVIPAIPAEGSSVGAGVGGGSGVMSRASSEDSGAAATPTSTSTTAAPILQPHELGVVQSEHSSESTLAHIVSQGGFESTSSSTISSQEQLSQEGKNDKERLSVDRLAAGEKGTNGTLKKKGQRGKQKQIKLNLVETTDEKVVKCALVTGTGQMVNFQFSIKYDKPLAIFQKLVKAGHLASQQEEEFVKQIKNVLSSTSAKKFNSAESATSTTAGATPITSTSTIKDSNKVAPVQEQAEVKVGATLEATKPSTQNSIETPSLVGSAGTTSAPMLSTTTSAIASGGLMVSASAGVQQLSSQPSSQPSSPPSDSIKISFSDTVPSTKVVSSSVAVVEHAQDSQSEPGISTLTTALSTTGGKQTYSQAVINGSGAAASKGVAMTITTAPIFTQTNLLAGATCTVSPGTLPTCPLTISTTSTSDLASLSSSSVVESNQVAPPVKQRKVFEVETVNETDSPSPDHSELSAHSSTENLSVEADVTSQGHSITTSDSEGYRNVVVNSVSHQVNPLESKSDSYISVRQQQQRGMVGMNVSGMGGIAEFGGSISNTPEPTPPPPASTNVVTVVYHPPQSGGQAAVSSHLPPGQTSDIVCGVPHTTQPQVSMQQYPMQPYDGDAGMKNRSISVGNAPPDWHSGYYHYHTAPQQHYISRQPIASDTYVPPLMPSNQHHTYHGPQQHFSPQARSFPMEQSQQHMTAHHHHLLQVHTHPGQPTREMDQHHQETTLSSSVPVQAQESYRTPQVPPPSHTISTESHSPGHTLSIDNFPQAGLLSQAFMQFMYSMSTIFRDPKYQPLLSTLDQQFGGGAVPPHSAPPTLPLEEEPGGGEQEREHSVMRCNTHPSLTRHREGDDELNTIIMKFKEEERELEKRKKKAIEDYRQKKKLSSDASSLDNSGPLPTSQKSSTDSHDIPLTHSPNQSRRAPVVDLENYQEAGKIGSVSLTTCSSQEPPLKRDPAADLEKKVRDELMAEWGESSPNHGHNQQEIADMMLSTRNFSSPPGIRSPRHLPSVQDLHAKASHMHSSKAYHHSIHHHHQKGAEGSPISPLPPASSTQSPVPRSPTLPAATFMLPTSPPPAPQQPIWMSRSHPQHPSTSYHTQPHHHVHQHHHNVTASTATTSTTAASKAVHHSDSGEWTEFASAPFNIGGQDSTLAPPSTVAASHSALLEGFPASHSTPALGTLTSCGSGGSHVHVVGGGGQYHHLHHQPHQKVGTDLSEFDPIAASTSGGSIPTSELQQNPAPFKHRT